jgi:hypothetical protein
LEDVFILGQAGQKAKGNANAQKLALVKKCYVEKKANAETWMPFMTWHKMNSWSDYNCHEIDAFNKFDAVHYVAQNEWLMGLYLPQDRYFQQVRCRLQFSNDRLDVGLSGTESSIGSLGIVFCHETSTTTYKEP